MTTQQGKGKPESLMVDVEERVDQNESLQR